MQELPEAPETPWTSDGLAAFGMYRGECEDLPFSSKFGRIERIREQKRWIWCGVLTDEVAIGLAIVRTGYAANVFCWVFDRQTMEFRKDISRVLPLIAVEVADTPPPDGRVARYRALVEGVDVQRRNDRWTIAGTVGDVRLDLEIREHGTPMTAICPTAANDGQRANVTRKQGIASASGTVRAGTTRYQLLDATALLDHTHGMLSGETVWQWAIGSGMFIDDGAPVAFNVVASFNDGLENTIWIEGEPTSAGPAEFEIPDERTEPWRVHNDRLDLSMVPDGLRAQDLDLGLVASNYLQPLGNWIGTVDGREVTAHGVAELHRSVW